jgi:3-dehydroquinate dehydratase/shikimate dehydrogenase
MYLCACSTATTIEEFRQDARRALAGPADLVELRLDLLSPEARQGLTQAESWLKDIASRLVITCRPIDQGGTFDGPATERMSMLLWASTLKPRFVDLEFSCLGRSEDFDRRIALLADSAAGHILISEHHFDGPAKTPREKLHRMQQPPAEAVKLCWRADDALANFEAFDLQQAGAARSVFCMGEDGVPSRILGKKLGTEVTYAALDGASRTAPGQPTIEELTQVYRWLTIDGATEVFGVVGDPIGHSLSPAVHNAAFAHEGLNAVYLAFRVPAGPAAFSQFLAGIIQRPWLDVRGLSITAPHKTSAFEHIKDALDPLTRRIGAVNTLTFEGNDVLGNNTDYQGAVNWLTTALSCDMADLAGSTVTILGNGGMARTIVAALTLLNARVTVMGRDARQCAALAGDFECPTASLAGTASISDDILINCTPVGTWPDREACPIEPQRIARTCHVFDVIYNPTSTRLLTAADAAGCSTSNGLDLFLEQAALQFARWTGRPAPRKIMAQAARAALAAPDPYAVSP